jgi:hypothetical protein
MAQDNGGRFNASEDTSEAREHMRNVQENTEALADQARRVEATAPDTTDRPVEGLRVDGMGGATCRRTPRHFASRRAASTPPLRTT